MKLPSLRTTAIAAVALLAAGYSLVFFYAPNDADQGFIQKIFYLHVPLAICALAGFILAGVHSILHLRSGDSKHDARSYVSIHISVIFGVAVLATGAIWARASWGKWWVWQEPTLVSFLIVFLLYCTYYPLRYAIADRERQARYASVFAITAGAFVPLNFIAVRLASPLVHPRVFATANGGLPGSMLFTFLVCLAAVALLWVTLMRFELAAKSSAGRLRRLRRALDGDVALAGGVADRPGRAAGRCGVVLMSALPLAAPALPLHAAGKYVAAAYIVFLVLLAVYVAIMAAKIGRIDRELGELAELADERERREQREREGVAA